MSPNDLLFAAKCTEREEWTTTDLSVFDTFYRNHPEGCLVARLDGERIGICVATPYGESGFIGTLIVDPEVRGRGIGAALLNHAVEHLRGLGARTVYLDGVMKAVPLYERNGFRRVCLSARFKGQISGRDNPAVRQMTPDDLTGIFALDRKMFGADRSFFLAQRLKLYPHFARVCEKDGQIKGFIMGSGSREYIQVSPWVMAEPSGTPETDEMALYLLESAVIGVEGPQFVGVLETNLGAIQLLRDLGFEERPNPPMRMAKGPDSSLGASGCCYAIGSAAKG